MTAVVFEHPTHVARPARVVHARRPVLRPAAAPLVQLPGHVPAWLMPELHSDPRFALLAGMDRYEAGIALLGSGADWQAYHASTLRRPVEHYITLALRGLDALGVAEVRGTATRYREAISAGHVNPYQNFPNVVPERNVLRPWFTDGRLRYARTDALDAGHEVAFTGFRHDQSPSLDANGRCLSAGICAHCYPGNFPGAGTNR